MFVESIELLEERATSQTIALLNLQSICTFSNLSLFSAAASIYGS